jgi:hypothetical protein
MQAFLEGPGRVHIGGQVVDPPQEDAFSVEVHLPVTQLHGTRTEPHGIFVPVAADSHLVQWLLSPVPGPPGTNLR